MCSAVGPQVLSSHRTSIQSIRIGSTPISTSANYPISASPARNNREKIDRADHVGISTTPSQKVAGAQPPGYDADSVGVN